MRISKVIIAVVVAAVVLLAAGVGLGLFRGDETAPLYVEPEMPAGTLYWAEAEFEFRHAFSDATGRGVWMAADVQVEHGIASTYTKHNITVWEETLDEGFSWNLEGECSLRAEVRVSMVGLDGRGYRELLRWPEPTPFQDARVLISFPCNQGAFGSLFFRPPTFFISEALPGDYGYRYYVEFEGDLAFVAKDYQEVDSFGGRATGGGGSSSFCPVGSNC